MTSVFRDAHGSRKRGPGRYKGPPDGGTTVDPILVDDRDGWKEGEHAWKRDNIPVLLHVGWDALDVLKRWEREVWELEEQMGLVDSNSVPPLGGIKIVKEKSTKSI
ncbi:MAG: hypothetical protein M1823_008294, partial [Watsoniomyces obsoletus]